MRIPVLFYHHVGPLRPGTFRSLTVSPRRFERHIRWLRARGYSPIRCSDWVAWLDQGLPIPTKPVLITFDDAYYDLAEYALPVLIDGNCCATLFVVTGQIGGTNNWDVSYERGNHRLMTADQIADWAARGFEVGAHSRTHADLASIPPDQLEDEVSGCSDDLARLLGERVGAFAYPYGFENEHVRACVQRAFRLAFITGGGLNDAATDRYRLRRNMVQRHDSTLDLFLYLKYGWSPLQRVRQRIIAMLERISGLIVKLSARSS